MNWKFLTIFVVAGYMFSAQAYALSLKDPFPYVVEAGEFVFVMLTENAKYGRYDYRLHHEKYKEFCGAVGNQVKERCARFDNSTRYPKSGLYKKDDPSKPLWSIDWYAFSIKYVSTDGAYLVRTNFWSQPDELSLAFYKYGKLLAEYKRSDLLESTGDPTIFHLPGNWDQEVTFDVKTAQFFVKTIEGTNFTFDGRTGRMVEGKMFIKSRPDRSAPFKQFSE